MSENFKIESIEWSRNMLFTYIGMECVIGIRIIFVGLNNYTIVNLDDNKPRVKKVK